ncbi:MAG: response regulator [Opitutaceae bacterium]
MIAPSLAPLSILVADDEEGIRNLLAKWLGSRGHTVACADSGQNALHLLNRQHFDLVITDIMMPDGDGFELIPAVRKTQPEARIVAISGGGQFISSADCLALARGLGAHATLLKPFKWEQVRAGLVSAMPPGFDLNDAAAA